MTISMCYKCASLHDYSKETGDYLNCTGILQYSKQSRINRFFFFFGCHSYKCMYEHTEDCITSVQISIPIYAPLICLTPPHSSDTFQQFYILADRTIMCDKIKDWWQIAQVNVVMVRTLFIFPNQSLLTYIYHFP